ncbi:uncharacterized protein BDZ83DRAFT_598131 [Colletotrichum acutatum]|uniref:Secreted protein n=1 Tax=Glomerella acutata TaxID=27357 RepID=A0AAD8XQK4_GLOAC|nr:uncharacterized protein BDZ83DRAFT_598131 [Colletotrichum acutatum]KAK1731622.1 hypothetical protein BDZ83DRAFT_598131 [Colletotrichum acutatum]
MPRYGVAYCSILAWTLFALARVTYAWQQLVVEDCNDKPAPRHDTSFRSRLRQHFYGRGVYATRSRHRCRGFVTIERLWDTLSRFALSVATIIALKDI